MGLKKSALKGGNKVIKKLSAVEKITDQTTLANIARNKANDFWVRITAAGKLIEHSIAQEVYVDIAKSEENPYLIFYALYKITDQAALLDIARNIGYIPANSDLIYAYIEKMVNQTVLADAVAKMSESLQSYYYR